MFIFTYCSCWALKKGKKVLRFITCHCIWWEWLFFWYWQETGASSLKKRTIPIVVHCAHIRVATSGFICDTWWWRGGRKIYPQKKQENVLCGGWCDRRSARMNANERRRREKHIFHTQKLNCSCVLLRRIKSTKDRGEWKWQQWRWWCLVWRLM